MIIEKNIPIPSNIPTPGRPYKYAIILDMEVLDSVLIPNVKRENAISGVSNVIRRYKLPWKIQAVQIGPNTRIWRVE